MLLHSNGGSAYEFEHVIDDLAKRYRVIAWDMPGQGDSDPLPRHHSVEDYADAVVALMDVMGVPKAHVLGASIGGAICVALGARHAARMSRVFITECPFRTPEEWQKGWANTEANYCSRHAVHGEGRAALPQRRPASADALEHRPRRRRAPRPASA